MADQSAPPQTPAPQQSTSQTLLRVKRPRTSELPASLHVVPAAKRVRLSSLLSDLSLETPREAKKLPGVYSGRVRKYNRLSRSEQYAALQKAEKVVDVGAHLLRRRGGDAGDGGYANASNVLCNGVPMVRREVEDEEFEIYVAVNDVDAGRDVRMVEGDVVGLLFAEDVPELEFIFGDEEEEEDVGSDSEAASVDYPSTPDSSVGSSGTESGDLDVEQDEGSDMDFGVERPGIREILARTRSEEDVDVEDDEELDYGMCGDERYSYIENYVED